MKRKGLTLMMSSEDGRIDKEVDEVKEKKMKRKLKMRRMTAGRGERKEEDDKDYLGGRKMKQEEEDMRVEQLE